MKLIKNTAFQVLIAIIAGVLLGYFNPALAVQMDIVGKGFISIIKIFIAPIIFLTVVLGISGMDNFKKVGRIGAKALLYFEIITTLSLGLGLLVAHFLQPGDIDMGGLAPKDASTYTHKTQEAFNWWHFLATNFTLQVLLAGVLCGFIIIHLKQKEKIIWGLTTASHYVFAALKYVMYLAPLGAFGGIAFAVGKFGLQTLLPLAKLMGCMYLTMALFIFGVLGLVMRYYRQSIFKFVAYIKEEILLVFATSSSEPALPSLMNKLENMGCSKPVVGLVVPAGYSFNLDGTSIYLSMAVLFIAQLYKVPLSFSELLSIIGILMITSKGAAGVTGSGFIVLASTLTALHNIPVEGLAFLLGIDKFMSEARAITNVIGNGVATIVISKTEKEFHEFPTVKED